MPTLLIQRVARGELLSMGPVVWEKHRLPSAQLMMRRPKHFDKIVFVSLKSRELDDDGVRDLAAFSSVVSPNSSTNLLVNSAAPKSPRPQRISARACFSTLFADTQTLLILDNLESLLKSERDTVFTFVKKLPPGCKAILTSRGRIGSAAEELILEKLSESAALATLAKLAESNPALAKTSAAERLELYHETVGQTVAVAVDGRANRAWELSHFE